MPSSEPSPPLLDFASSGRSVCCRARDGVRRIMASSARKKRRAVLFSGRYGSGGRGRSREELCLMIGVGYRSSDDDWRRTPPSISVCAVSPVRSCTVSISRISALNDWPEKNRHTPNCTLVHIKNRLKSYHNPISLMSTIWHLRAPRRALRGCQHSRRRAERSASLVCSRGASVDVVARLRQLRYRHPGRSTAASSCRF